VSHEIFEPVWVEQGFGTGLQEFQQLVRHRIRDILLVSSLFDFYLFEEEGLLYEQIQSEYQGLQLSHSPDFTRVSSGAEALAMLRGGERFDLIVTTLHIEDMTPLRLARGIRESGIAMPIVLLAYDNRELNDLITHHGSSAFDRIFIWQGDFRLMIAIIKNLEDELNVRQDTSRFGVQCIMLIEDNIRYASYFLPLLYSEVISHSQRLISEGLNSAHRSLRLRARPKILLRSTWEEALRCFEEYEQHIIGVISDVGFPRGGQLDPRAGFEFAREVKARFFDIPVLLQSTNPDNEKEAWDTGALFLAKNSPTVVDDFRRILREYFSFGDFVFRIPDGKEVARATDLKSLEEQLQVVPDESLLYHASRNDFSNWLKARTEFGLAFRLRPRKVSDYASIAELRADVIRQLHEHRSFRQRGLLTEFSKDTFDPSSSFARSGGGSVGGKARGLAFLNALLSTYNVGTRFEGLDIEVPPAIVIGTEVFDRFLEENGLHSFALGARIDEEIHDRFVSAERFPEETAADLAAFLDLCREPLAVRSSSLLEDSQFHPFAGVYQTFMIPNSSPDPSVRLQELLTAIKRVYASTFYRAAREYIKVTSLRVEDEKMAVIVQKMVGARHGPRFYPEISGVARSYNFYPVGPQKPEEGTVSVALGLGKTIVEGGATVRFCPRYPDHLQQFFSPRDARRNNQRDFYALEMTDRPTEVSSIADERVLPHALSQAEEDGTLQSVASTYSAENDALYDGVSRPGTRIVTFAPILRNKTVPLPKAIDFLSALGTWGIGTPVEIEFAVNLSVPRGGRNKLGLLQMRPLLLSRETEELRIDDMPLEQLICQSSQVLGHGAIRDLRDIVVVDFSTFDRSRSYEVACEIARINDRLVDEQRGYLLIGPGRWGTLDPLLGIPVKWDQICGAKAIVEAGFRDMSVDPSQGSHFFQNLTAFQVGYFSVSPRVRSSFVDWDWLAEQEAIEEGPFVRHIRLEKEIVAKMNGHERRGVILKP
jgi:CheY-like chemotaxis protein